MPETSHCDFGYILNQALPPYSETFWGFWPSSSDEVAEDLMSSSRLELFLEFVLREVLLR